MVETISIFRLNSTGMLQLLLLLLLLLVLQEMRGMENILPQEAVASYLGTNWENTSYHVIENVKKNRGKLSSIN